MAMLYAHHMQLWGMLECGSIVEEAGRRLAFDARVEMSLVISTRHLKVQPGFRLDLELDVSLGWPPKLLLGNVPK